MSVIWRVLYFVYKQLETKYNLSFLKPSKQASSLSINALRTCVCIYIRQLISFRAPTLWFMDLTVATCHIHTFLSWWQFVSRENGQNTRIFRHFCMIWKLPPTITGRTKHLFNTERASLRTHFCLPVNSRVPLTMWHRVVKPLSFIVFPRHPVAFYPLIDCSTMSLSGDLGNYNIIPQIDLKPWRLVFDVCCPSLRPFCQIQSCSLCTKFSLIFTPCWWSFKLLIFDETTSQTKWFHTFPC